MSSSRAHDLLRDQIILAISGSGLARVWPCEVGLFRVYDQPGKVMRVGVNGLPDITGILRNGRWIGIEVKTGKGQLRQSQINFRAMIERFGGLFIVGREVDQVISDISKSL